MLSFQFLNLAWVTVALIGLLCFPQKQTLLQVNALEDALKKCLGGFQSYRCYKLRKTSFNWSKGHFKEGLESLRGVLSTGPCWKDAYSILTTQEYDIFRLVLQPSYDEKPCPTNFIEASSGSSSGFCLWRPFHVSQLKSSAPILRGKNVRWKKQTPTCFPRETRLFQLGWGSWVFGPERKKDLLKSPQ